MLQPLPPPGPRTSVFVDDVSGRAALDALVADVSPEVILVASVSPGGGVVGNWVQAHGAIDSWWWRTGVPGRTSVHPGPDAGTTPAVAHGPLKPLAIASGSTFAGSLLEPPRMERSTLPLWDGDYVLAPVPLEGEPGRRALEAFAVLCEHEDAIDLVVLSNPNPDFERIARDLGITLRVHFAGHAPRDAELAWLRSASAALLAGEGRLAGGLVLRALSSGCPLIAVEGSQVADAVSGWLASERCHDESAFNATLPERLHAAVLRHDAVNGAVERGRTLAARHTIDMLVPELAAALLPEHEVRKAA